MDYCSSMRNLDAVLHRPNFKFVKGNLLSADLMSYVLETEKIDTIIHAAAQTHVDNSFGNSFAFTENNVLGTHVLVEAAKTAGIKRFIHVSTDEVYGSSYDEDPCRKEVCFLVLSHRSPSRPHPPPPHRLFCPPRPPPHLLLYPPRTALLPPLPPLSHYSVFLCHCE